MIAIQLSNITLVLGATAIFRGLNWEIQDDQKIGLIGPNGAEKSSLLKLISGEHTPEPGGAVVKARQVFAGYLPQQPEFDPFATAMQLVVKENIHLNETRRALSTIEMDLGNPDVYLDTDLLTKAIDRQQHLLQEYQTIGGDGYELRARQVLFSLGLPEANLEKPLAQLSGGQKKLVGLACLVLQQPPVLLLDEPDNHFDLPGKTYLEQKAWCVVCGVKCATENVSRNGAKQAPESREVAVKSVALELTPWRSTPPKPRVTKRHKPGSGIARGGSELRGAGCR